MFKFISRVWTAVVGFFFGKKEEAAPTSTQKETEPAGEVKTPTPAFEQEETVAYGEVLKAVVTAMENTKFSKVEKVALAAYCISFSTEISVLEGRPLKGTTTVSAKKHIVDDLVECVKANRVCDSVRHALHDGYYDSLHDEEFTLDELMDQLATNAEKLTMDKSAEQLIFGALVRKAGIEAALQTVEIYSFMASDPVDFYVFHTFMEFTRGYDYTSFNAETFLVASGFIKEGEYAASLAHLHGSVDKD
jgi:hypothetical protein